MHEGRPSLTAFATARARAFHQIADEPRIFTDPLAVRITGFPPEEVRETDTDTTEQALWQQRRRIFLAGRARFAEETIAAAVDQGATQVVVLGAGLDTFAYRNPYSSVRVFEVDHPATQAWKRTLLTEVGIDIPPTMAFVPVDFETRTVSEGLAAAGFARSQPAVFVWLGVTMYLDRETVLSTLRAIAAQDAWVQVVFDYITIPEQADAKAAFQTRADRVAAAGEPWLSFFTAEEIRKELGEIGYEVEDFTGNEVLARYLPPESPNVSDTHAPPHIVRAVRSQ
ncbi:class I SAM-dependent methyltransferase [Nocardia sp. NPDC050406]|uniref:class I SAM-dependent methyltransferase n=1 Tax=Nocardia sp. NPDC050406 TaxID=3364318 RepID=UPI00378E6A87